jgi:hypothetical protein
MGKLTSTIGIPIKLLNEAQVIIYYPLPQVPLSDTVGLGPRHHPRALNRARLPRQAARSRRQHERPAEGHHRDRARRPRLSPRPGLHPGKPCTVLHRARHAEECADV